MNAWSKPLTEDKIIRYATAIALALLVLHVGYVVVLYNNIPPVVPLYNQMPWGETRLGDKLQSFIPFLAAAGIIITNLILSSVLYEKMPLISRMLGVMNLLTALLSTIFIFRIMQLVM